MYGTSSVVGVCEFFEVGTVTGHWLHQYTVKYIEKNGFVEMNCVQR